MWTRLRATWLRLSRIVVWTLPENIEVLNALSLAIWAILLVSQPAGIASVPALAPWHQVPPGWALGVPLGLLGCAQLWGVAFQSCRLRMGALLASIAWWAFLDVAVTMVFGGTPPIGSYLASTVGCVWAYAHVNHWRSWERHHHGH